MYGPDLSHTFAYKRTPISDLLRATNSCCPVVFVQIRFGIVRVNYFEPPLLERNVKDSGYWFSKNFFRSSA